jgi:hypothetical protein
MDIIINLLSPTFLTVFFFNVKLKKYKKMKLIFGGCVTRAKLDLCDIRRKLRGLLMTRHNVLR